MVLEHHTKMMQKMLVILFFSVVLLQQVISKDISCQKGSTAIIPHPTKCAQYYDCGDNTEVWRWPLHLKECPYEQLFNLDTKKCEHYSMVKCGQRDEPISFCDYEVNLCRVGTRCMPCHVRHPPCKNLPDGLNPWKTRGDPFYIVCKNNRTVYEGMCVNHRHEYANFDAKQRMCVKY